MKRLIYLAFAVIGMLSPGCDNTIRETVEYMINEPVFMAVSDFRNLPIQTEVPREIETRGKLCFYEGYLYISEPGKGIHVIDNRNPSSPTAVGFVELLGNADIAIRDNKLYADALIDLLWFDISNPAKPQLLGRLIDLFADVMPVADNEYGLDYGMCYAGSSNGIVVGWTLKKRVEEITYERPRGELMNDAMGNAWNINTSESSSNSGGGSSVGANGSMSRFGLYKDYLYAVINGNMSVIDLSGPEPVKAVENLYIGNVETIFAYGDNLFLGTPTGMSIYSVTNPLDPQRMSTVSHVYACDPVVVDNNLAYVTVHSGNNCGQSINELLIIDVSDVTSPQLIVSYAMTKPKGLGIDNGALFLCDAGLKIFKIGDPQQLMANRLAHFADMDGYDVIPYNNVLMMVADDGLYQYDYSDLDKITRLSKISIGK
jgi:hypothetical protein